MKRENINENNSKLNQQLIPLEVYKIIEKHKTTHAIISQKIQALEQCVCIIFQNQLMLVRYACVLFCTYFTTQELRLMIGKGVWRHT